MRLLYDARLAGRGLGISTFVLELAGALIATGELELVWLGDRQLTPTGAAGVVHAARRPYPLLDGPMGRGLARRLGADVVHFTGNTGWRRPAQVPSVLTLHDLLFLDSDIRARSLRQVAGHRYERLVVAAAVAAADVLVVPSRVVAAEVVSRLRPARPPQVVHEGVAAPARERPPAGANGDPPYIVAFAGRDPRKETAAVVRAWRDLAQAPLRLRLLATGGMPPGLRESLAPEIATGDVVIDSHLPRAELWSLLAGALALVYPTREEGFGLPVLEGMAAGIPVLSGVAPATREIGGDAILQLDPADIAGSTVITLRRLLDDPALAAAVGRRGLVRSERFTWHATAAGYLQAYSEAVARRP